MQNLSRFNIKKNLVSYQYGKANNKLLSFSLMWLSIALAIVFLIALSITYVEPLKNAFNRFLNGTALIFVWILLPILQLGTYFLINYLVANNKSLSSIILTFFIFVLIESIFVTILILLISTNINLQTTRNILLIALVPLAVFFFMGVLGYFQIFNFSKLVPILIGGSLILIIMGIVSFFTFNDIFYVLYSLLAVIIFSGWIGFDFYIIRKKDEEMAKVNNYTNLDYLKISITFGIRLLIDFIALIINIFRLVTIFSN